MIVPQSLCQWDGWSDGWPTTTHSLYKAAAAFVFFLISSGSSQANDYRYRHYPNAKPVVRVIVQQKGIKLK